MALQPHVNDVPVRLITHCFIMVSIFKYIYSRNEHTSFSQETEAKLGGAFIIRDKVTGNCLAAYVGKHSSTWTAQFYLNTWESKCTTTLFADAYLCGVGHFKSTSPANTKWHCHYCTVIQQDTCHTCAQLGAVAQMGKDLTTQIVPWQHIIQVGWLELSRRLCCIQIFRSTHHYGHCMHHVLI